MLRTNSAQRRLADCRPNVAGRRPFATAVVAADRDVDNIAWRVLVALPIIVSTRGGERKRLAGIRFVPRSTLNVV